MSLSCDLLKKDTPFSNIVTSGIRYIIVIFGNLMMTISPAPVVDSIVIPPPFVILFDWDDTLIHTWPFLWKLYKRTFHHFGKNIEDFLDESTCKDYAVRNGRRTFIEAFGEDIGQQARDFFLKTYQEESLPSLTPITGAQDVLDTLKQQRIPMGIVSNKESRFLKREITHMGWDHYFQSIVGRDVAGAKPTPAPIYHALDEMQLHHLFKEDAGDYASLWFIGDTNVDKETAKAVGCTFIGFGDFFTPSNDSMPVQNEKSVVNWNQFHSLLSEIHLKYA